MTWLWVMLGSALGGVARYWLSGVASHHIGETFPIGTLIVNGRPLHEAIVKAARDARVAGATVLRGPMGFGRSSRLHTTKILRLSEDLPLVIENVDTQDAIRAFLPMLDSMMGGGLVTLEKVPVLQYGAVVKHAPA